MPAPQNRFREGDNLAVLGELPTDSVDLVYLDPPYNTGSPLVYPDRRSHAEWLDLMRPRLAEVRRVLAPTGALFASIDDHEQARLRLLLDEVVGEELFRAQVVVNLNPKGRQLGGGFATSHEYLLVYAGSQQCALEPSLTETVDPRDFPLTDEQGQRYRLLPLRNTNKRFNPATARTLHYPLWGHPESGRVGTAAFEGAQEVWPVFGDGAPAVWRWSAVRAAERSGELTCRLVRGIRGGRLDVSQVDRLHPGRRKKLTTVWLAEEIGSTDTAVAETKALLGRPLFESPKPTGLLLRILATMPADARVLDPFAGSGTTGHAVALANAADGGSRTCLSIQSGDPVRPGRMRPAAGLRTVAEVTRARLRAADPGLVEG